ncbi:MAG: hypothetical protein KTR29_07545 [Rhodothermaceae bacterium]|nr:hypothetical protein [Rhodothermaceae bacterium]
MPHFALRRTDCFITPLCILLVFLTSCEQPGATSTLPIQLDTPQAERVLSYYFGSYVDASPFESSILKKEEGRILIDLNQVNEWGLSQTLEDVNSDGIIDWDELEPFLASTYYEARGFPSTLDALYDQISTPHPDSGWQAIEIDGMMVSARRRVLVKESAIQEALRNYQANNAQIIYPVGTTFIGHHYDENQRLETTISQKRKDNFWDFFIYDQDGQLTSTTQTGPKELTAPTRCVGCHFGGKMFEPEASFPEFAPDGPFGKRGIYVEEEARNKEITGLLDEHTKRSDTVLGLYGTIYLSRIQEKLEAGTSLSETEALLLEMIKP